jgi:hypothetical protein
LSRLLGKLGREVFRRFLRYVKLYIEDMENLLREKAKRG